MDGRQNSAGRKSFGKIKLFKKHTEAAFILKRGFFLSKFDKIFVFSQIKVKKFFQIFVIYFLKKVCYDKDNLIGRIFLAVNYRMPFQEK